MVRYISLLLFIGLAWEQIRNNLTPEEYQNLTIEEKANYDVNSKNLWKWTLYGPVVAASYLGLVEDCIGCNETAIDGLVSSYFLLNIGDKYPEANFTASEKIKYEKVYYRTLNIRRLKYAGIPAIIGIAGIWHFKATFSLDLGDNFGFIQP